MALSIVVPCFNEPLEQFRASLSVMDGYFAFEPEFLIMENGSELLKGRFTYPRYRYFHRPERGLGWALREGIRNASSSEVYFLPADLSYDLSFVSQARAYLHTGYSMVIGSKGLADSQVFRPMKRQFISEVYNTALKLRYGPGWPSDITGTKAYIRRDVLPLLDHCDSDGIYFEVQLMKALRMNGLRVKEIAVKVKDHRPSRFNPLTKAS